MATYPGYQCDKDLLSQIFEYKSQVCTPTKCPAVVKNYCKPNPCKNNGKCLSFPGSCTWKYMPRFQGRHYSIKAFVFIGCEICDGFKCPENQNTCKDAEENDVALCIRKKPPAGDRCDKDLLSQIYEYKSQVCTPTKCPAVVKNYCKPNPCENNGKCLPFPGSYSCDCMLGFHGRNCSVEGHNYKSSYILVIYNTIVGWKNSFLKGGEYQDVRHKTLIFVGNRRHDTNITFSSSCSVEKSMIKMLKPDDNTAREKCKKVFITDETVFKYCKDYLPDKEMYYALIYHDIPYDNTDEPHGSVVMSYNQEAKSYMAGFKVSNMIVALYNGEDEQYKESFQIISNLQKKTGSECQTPVILLVLGIRCDKPLRRKRNEKISFKSVFETQPKLESGATCNYLYPSYYWETFRYDDTVSKEVPERDKTLPSKNCSQFELNNDDKYCRESFEIEPYDLSLGTYQIKLTVNAMLQKTLGEKTASPIKFETFGSYFIVIEPSPLIAVIEGGDSRTVSVNDPVVFDGSLSHDPNYPPDKQKPLKYHWSCKGVPDNRCCKSLNVKKCEMPGRPQLGKEYEFTLKIETTYDQLIFAEVTQKVTVSQKPQIQLKIRCLKNCGLDGFRTNPREIVYMDVSVLDETRKSEDITFIWKYSCGNEDMKSVSDIKQDDVDSHILVVKENQLTPGSECKFTVNTDPNAADIEGRSSIHIQVNVPLTMGACEMSSDCEPNECFKGKSKFKISCSNFTNHIESAQLVYSFYQNDGLVNPGTLLGFSQNGELDVTLTEESITVRVSDHFGMYIDYRTKVPVKLKDWVPNDDEMDKLLNDLETLVSSRDSSNSAMAVGVIIDVLKNVSKKSEILEKALNILSTGYINDLSDVKLYSSTMKKIVSKGIKDSKTEVNSKIVESLGELTQQLSRQLLQEVISNTKMFPAISDEEIKDITLSMMESADVVVGSENEKALDVSTGTLVVFARSNQYKKGIARMLGGLVLSGMAILNTLLPHQNEVVIMAENTTMWTKVESPVILTNFSGIPQNISTKIKMPKEFGNKLQRISENVALQVIAFDSNPYWYDLEDQDVASEIISVNAWRQPESGLKAFRKKLITDISEEFDVYLKIKSTRSETKTGSVTMPGVSASVVEKDEAVAVHTIEAPPENSNGMLIVEFMDLGKTEFRVLLSENVRPDYEMMMNESKIVNEKSPQVRLMFNDIPHDTLHFIGILPAKQKYPGQTINYKFNMYSIQCKVRQETRWTSPACKVGDETSKDVVHCKCSHLSFFGSSIFVGPNTIHPIKDIKLLLTLKDNPLVFTVIVIILIIYVIFLFWALRKDKYDILKRKVIVLQDNFPGENYFYLVVVYTSFNYGAGTDSNVGIELVGENNRSSRSHILRSPERKVFRRNSDDWFLITTPIYLKQLIAIHIWHDNSGFHPDWYCDKIVVYDIHGGTDYTFLVERWLGVWPGEYTEALVSYADLEEINHWRRVIMHNIKYNLQEKHLWLSIYMSHPRATVPKSQRLTIAFCIILITLLTGVMFYGVAKGGVRTDEPEYQLKLRVFIVAVQCAVIATLATAPVVICFKRSQIIKTEESSTQDKSREKNNKQVQFLIPKVKSSTSDNELQKSKRKNAASYLGSTAELTIPDTGKRVWFKNLTKKMLTGKPLIPVVVGKETADSVIVRRRWARCGWVMSQIVIWGSGYLIILYGLKLGKVISELWITSAGLSISTGAFVNSPMKIIIVSLGLSLFGEICNVTTFEFDPEKAVKQELFGDEEHLANVIKMRSSAIYKPLDKKKKAELHRKAFYCLRWLDRGEFFASVLIFLTLLYISGDLWMVKSFQVTSHIKKTLSTSHGKNVIPLNDVISLKKLTDYLISKLFRVLYTGRWYNRKTRLTSLVESQDHTGWFSDTVHRLVGIPRMRQLRVKPVKCPWADFFNISTALCGRDLGPDTEDTGNHGLKWGNVTKDINKGLLVPWSYQRVEGKERFVYGASGEAYHTGGYIQELASTQEECNEIVIDLVDLDWWDYWTRVFITEVTLYNPNTDTYSFVSIVIEHRESGLFTRNIEVTTCHLEYHPFWKVIYFGILVFFNANLFIFANRYGIVTTLTYFWSCFDIVFVSIANTALIFHLIKLIRTSTVVDVFQEAGGFFYFSDIVWYERTSLILWSIAFILTPIRLFKYKPFVSTFQKAYNTLFRARKFLLTISLQMIILTFIQLFLVNYSSYPRSHPLSIDTRYYRASVKEPRGSPSGYYQGIFTITLAIRLLTYSFFLRMVLIAFYKVSLINKF